MSRAGYLAILPGYRAGSFIRRGGLGPPLPSGTAQSGTGFCPVASAVRRIRALAGAPPDPRFPIRGAVASDGCRVALPGAVAMGHTLPRTMPGIRIEGDPVC